MHSPKISCLLQNFVFFAKRFCSLSKEKYKKYCKNIAFSLEKNAFPKKLCIPLQKRQKFPEKFCKPMQSFSGNTTYLQEKAKVLQALKYNLFTILQTKWKVR